MNVFRHCTLRESIVWDPEIQFKSKAWTFLLQYTIKKFKSTNRETSSKTRDFFSYLVRNCCDATTAAAIGGRRAATAAASSKGRGYRRPDSNFPAKLVLTKNSDRFSRKFRSELSEVAADERILLNLRRHCRFLKRPD